MSVLLHRETLEYVAFPIDTSPVDPATLSHEVALIPWLDQPADSDWFAAQYLEDQVFILVQASLEAPSGGEDITLDIGRWRLWWKPTSNPEIPVRMVGIVSVV